MAEGEKESAILRAEAAKQTAILKAEGEAESLRNIKQAEADSIRMVKEAEAAGLKMINESNPSEQALKLRYYDALTKVANGQATKIFLPSDMEKIGSVASVAKEVLK